MKYVYSFQVWPDETWTLSFVPQVFQVFEAMAGRIEMEFTEDEFAAFRFALSTSGFTLREIERVPYHEPESIL